MTTKNPILESQLVTTQRLERVSTFIAEHTTFKGDFTADEDVDLGIKIDGKLEGSVIVPTGGVVHIGPTGHVTGTTIEADYVFVEGTVDGKIISRKGVEFTGSSSVKGAVDYFGSCNMHNLAKVRGTVSYVGAE